MLRKIINNKKLFIGLIMMFIFIIVGIFAQQIAPYGFEQTYVGKALDPPSLNHWFGTDRLGRDVFSRVIFGTRISLIVSLFVAIISLLLGVPIGLISGYFGHLIDQILNRIIDMVLSIPWILMALIIAIILGPSTKSVIIALSLTYFPQIVRVTRGAVLILKEQDFVNAAIISGESKGYIIFRYILGNCLAPVIVQVTIIMSFSILGEAAISYLGYGTQPPTPSWGLLLQQATNYLWTARYLVIFPALFILFVVLAFNFIGDGLRDILDPRYKRIYG